MSQGEVSTEAFAARLLRQNIEAYEVACVYLGERLGLYAALDAAGRATSAELARACAADERYVREWLEQQAVSGVLRVEDAAADPRARRYALPAEHASVLLRRDDPAYLGALPRFTVGVWSQLAALQRAFRSGDGVAYAAYGPDAREGQADVNRAMFVNQLAGWFAQMPDVHARLQADPPARVADVGCGAGASSIALAKAYPRVEIVGIDSDRDSIELAREAAKAAGVAGRVRFEVQDAASVEGRFDLVTVFEALHDMARPVEALRAMGGLLAPGASIVVADERTLERFTAPGPEPERLYYGWSVLFCLPTSREAPGSAATGAAMRPDVLRAYAREAGLAAEVMPVDHELWRFYRLRPGSMR